MLEQIGLLLSSSSLYEGLAGQPENDHGRKRLVKNVLILVTDARQSWGMENVSQPSQRARHFAGDKVGVKLDTGMERKTWGATPEPFV